MRRPRSGAEIALHRVGVGLEAGVDLAAVAPGCAESRILRLHEHHLGARLRGMQSRGEPGDPAAHDGDIRTHWPSRGGVGGRGAAMSR